MVDHHATEGRSWRLRLTGPGARTARLPALAIAAGDEPDAADAAARALPVTWSLSAKAGFR